MADTEVKRQPNDDLLIMTQDGDMYIDPNVRQDMGLLFSDVNNWALPVIPPAPLYTFRRPTQQPAKEYSLFVYRQDPPPPTDSAMVMNRVLAAVEALSARDQWKPYKPMLERAANWKYLIAAISMVAVAVMGIWTIRGNLEMQELEMKIMETRATLEAQPTADGTTPTDAEIIKLLEQTGAMTPTPGDGE